MSKRAKQSVSAADQLQQLFKKATERILANVDKYGFSIPMAFALTPDGQDLIIVADASIVANARGEEEPEPDEPATDLRKRTESILFNVHRMIDRGQLRAVAFARNLNITMDSDKGPVQRQAVKVMLDHEAGGGSIAYLIYDPNNGNANPLELFYNPLEERFFPDGGWPPDKPREPLV